MAKVKKAKMLDNGNIERAVITILDGRSGDGDDSVTQLGIVSINGIETSAGSVMKASSSLIKAKSKLLNEAGEKEISALTQIFGQTKSYVVPINPKSLHFHGHGEEPIHKIGMAVSEEGEGGTRQSEAAVSPMSIHMDFELVFNRVDPDDAFLENKVTPSLMGAVRTLRGTTKNCSVQLELEGFLAAARIFDTSMMSISWGSMFYCGLLDSVHAEYKMFNPKGEPIYGTVHVSMILIDKEVNSTSKGMWEEAYEEAFKGGSNNLTGKAQKWGSMINFNL